MALSILVSEEDLRGMPPELRDRLLKWYFDSRPAKVPAQLPIAIERHDEPILRPEFEGSLADSRRITFAELVRAKLLRPGDQICCRTLKRQRRKGMDEFITGAKVTPEGRVEFQVQKFSSPSKLAKAMVNANGGKAEALNGYDYLFVQTVKGLVRLDELRGGVTGASPAEEAAVSTH